MSGNGADTIFVISIFYLVTMVYSALVILSQQRVVNRLTDKLMARNYGEYKSMNGVKEEDASPVREDDEPKSWHDH